MLCHSCVHSYNAGILIFLREISLFVCYAKVEYIVLMLKQINVQLCFIVTLIVSFLPHILSLYFLSPYQDQDFMPLVYRYHNANDFASVHVAPVYILMFIFLNICTLKIVATTLITYV